ncbi:MAG: hypothetical protein WCR20_01360 [Verrucomicrobiota bacterium]
MSKLTEHEKLINRAKNAIKRGKAIFPFAHINTHKITLLRTRILDDTKFFGHEEVFLREVIELENLIEKEQYK